MLCCHSEIWGSHGYWSKLGDYDCLPRLKGGKANRMWNSSVGLCGPQHTSVWGLGWSLNMNCGFLKTEAWENMWSEETGGSKGHEELHTLYLFTTYWNAHVKEGKMGGTRSTHGADDNYTFFLSKILKGKPHMGYLGVDVRSTLIVIQNTLLLKWNNVTVLSWIRFPLQYAISVGGC